MARSIAPHSVWRSGPGRPRQLYDEVAAVVTGTATHGHAATAAAAAAVVVAVAQLKAPANAAAFMQLTASSTGQSRSARCMINGGIEFEGWVRRHTSLRRGCEEVVVAAETQRDHSSGRVAPAA